MVTHTNEASIMKFLLFMLIIIFGMNPVVGNAQSSKYPNDDILKVKIKTWKDSIRSLNPRKHPRYFGAEISFAFPQTVLKSNISQLKNLNMGYMGTTVGSIIANPIGKIKANVGMFTSDPSSKYSLDYKQASISLSTYILRLTHVKYHTLEPYVSAGFAYQRINYYGYYLPTDENGNAISSNYSTSSPPLLGQTGNTVLAFTAGVEYQLESDTDLFIHLFLETSYGMTLATSASSIQFDGTAQQKISSISIGINLGILR